MAADLHIHVLTKEFTEEHFKAFQSNTLGSQYFRPGYHKEFEKKYSCDLFSLCSDTPSIWVGSVSWLKAAILEDPDVFIPGTVEKVTNIIGENFPVIDDELIDKMREAMHVENSTQYDIAGVDQIIEFLIEHKGEKAFCISW